MSSLGGGALYVQGSSTSIELDSCTFFNCNSSSNAGAIYVEQSSSFFKSIHCIFSHCNAQYCAAVSSSTVNDQMIFASFWKCSSAPQICTNIVLLFAGDGQNCSYVNTTDTNANHHSGLHQTSAKQYVETRFINVGNHRNSQFIFGFASFPINSECSYVNMFNNTVSHSLVYMSQVTQLKLHYFLFKSNSGPVTLNDNSFVGSLYLLSCKFFEPSATLGIHIITMSGCEMNAQINTYPIPMQDKCNYHATKSNLGFHNNLLILLAQICV